MDYGKIITEILFVIVLIAGGYVFGPDMYSFYSSVLVTPCTNPTVYSIGTIDSGFGVSEEYLLSAIKEAEDSWEKAFNINLFNYSKGEGMKISLVYDYRQDSTQQLSSLDNTLNTDESLYDQLKIQYDSYVTQYNTLNSKIDKMVADYNKSGYKAKNAESLLSQIRSLEAQRNDLATKTEELQTQINLLISKYNLNVKNRNEINQSIDKQYEQGLYILDKNKKEIDIYQFDDKQNLVSVLIHEMGHSLGLGHSNNSSDIMYGLSSNNQAITEEDINNLKTICSKTWWDKIKERINKIKNERNTF